MFNSTVRKSALAVAFIALTVPAISTFAESTTPPTPPKVVTGGDPQPTGEVVMRTILLLSSLAVL